MVHMKDREISDDVTDRSSPGRSTAPPGQAGGEISGVSKLGHPSEARPVTYSRGSGKQTWELRAAMRLVRGEVNNRRFFHFFFLFTERKKIILLVVMYDGHACPGTFPYPLDNSRAIVPLETCTSIAHMQVLCTSKDVWTV